MNPKDTVLIHLDGSTSNLPIGNLRRGDAFPQALIQNPIEGGAPRFYVPDQSAIARDGFRRMYYREAAPGSSTQEWTGIFL